MITKVPFDVRQYLSAVQGARSIAEGIERAIENGDLAPGEALPTIRELAEQLAVNTTTVAAAYRQLQTRGLTYGERRRGTRVNGPAAAPPVTPISAGLVDLASGNPDPALLPDLNTALVSPREHRTSYGSPSVLPAFERAALRQLRADAIPCHRLLAVGGALDGIDRVLRARLRPGDRIALEDPCFSRTLDLVRSTSLTPEPVPCDDEGMDPGHLSRALRRGARAVVITPRAQNPFGSALTEVRSADLREVLREYPETLLIEDDHAALVVDCPPITLARGHRGPWAILRSYAKALGPDLRVAVLIGDEVTLARVERQQRLGVGWVSHILQGTTSWMLRQPEVENLLRVAQGIYTQRRTTMIRQLAERGIRAHGASGLNVWVPVPREYETVRALHERGYAVLAGEQFRLATGPGIRVTTAALPECEAPAFADALAAIVHARTSRTSLA